MKNTTIKHNINNCGNNGINKSIDHLLKVKCHYEIPLFVPNYHNLIKVKVDTPNNKDFKEWNLNYNDDCNTQKSTLPVLGPAKFIYKSQLSIGPFQKTFWKFIRLTNPFELVNSGKGRHSVIAIDTINRAYFKMIELLHNFDDDQSNLKFNKTITYAALAEGPGGFIQAVIDYRKDNYRDKIIGITLKNDYQTSTKWNNGFLKNKFQINFGDPEINDGNLLNPKNIIAYSKLFDKNKADLVTADGGFFVKGKKQVFKEQLHSKLFLCEVITALMVQKIGGIFILKIYDIFTKFTVQLLTLLSTVYEEIYITKPVTSRPANSEKYIVCKNYLGIPEEIIQNLLNSIDTDEFRNQNTYLESLWIGELSPQIIKSCVEINKLLLGYKLRHINDTLILTKKFTPVANNQNNKKFKTIQAQALIRQKKIAKIWADIHNIPVKK
jgi:23S rRNA U2552 (ribose-2'-O)-methylase RlmE/FtsJ